MAHGRVALLGDAAHPMRPFLAQGAAMALEDAAALGHVLQHMPDPQRDLPAALAHYAQQRWQRAARVQARSRRNGQVFHLDGLLRLGRDVALRALGARLMDLPWLYGYPSTVH
jgi:salicylate hydroxylase